MIKSLTSLRDLIYPKTCVLCEKKLQNQSQDLCQLCYNKTKVMESMRCEICSKPHIDQGALCQDCQNHARSHMTGYGHFIYEDQVKEAIYKMKFKRQTWIAKQFAHILAQAYVDKGMKKNQAVDGLVPVPMYFMKRGTRGYNPPQWMAKEMGRQWDLPVYDQVLLQVKPSKSQKSLGKAGRERNLNQAYAMHKKNKNKVKNKTLLLVDDVYTTGATVNACGKTLLEAGAKGVYFITIAIGKGL